MPKFSKGDVIGCGISFFKREIFFTHNGIHNGFNFNDYIFFFEKIVFYIQFNHFFFYNSKIYF